MKRRVFLKSLGIVSLGLTAPALSAPKTKQPNILFFFSDDHSIQTLGAYKSRMQEFIKKHGITKNIDKLAAQGALFENSFVCNSICGPSRAAILTGKHSHINGFKMNGDRFNPDQWTVAKALKNANYQTALIGKWHLNTMPRGFDDYKILPGQGKYYNPDFIVKGQSKNLRKKGYCSDLIGDMTIDWLEKKRDKSKPFFLCSWHKAPHRTWLPHPRHFNLLDDVDVPEPENLFDDYQGRTPAAANQQMSIRDNINLFNDVKVTPPVASTPAGKIFKMVEPTKAMDGSTMGEFGRMTQAQKENWDKYYVPRNEKFRAKKLKGKDLTRWKYQAYMKDYIKCIKAMDENVGKVLDYLKKNDLERDTIVIYSSDQGFYNGEHGWYDKRWMYEESLRNPLIIKWPKVTKPGTRVKQLVQNIDYAPTMLHAAGITVPKEVQGKSLVDLLKGKQPADWRKSILYTYYGPGYHSVAGHRGIRNDRYKLIEFTKSGLWEFYDLKNDPLEMKSQYNNPEYANIISQMKEELIKLMGKYKLNNN